MMQTDDGEDDQEAPRRGRQVPDGGAERLRGDVLHPAQRRPGGLAAAGPAGPLRPGRRHRLEGARRGHRAAASTRSPTGRSRRARTATSTTTATRSTTRPRRPTSSASTPPRRASRRSSTRRSTTPTSLRAGRADPAVLAGRRRRRRGAADRAVEAHHQRAARRPGLQRLRLAQPRRPRRSTTRTSGGTRTTPCRPGQLALNFGRLKDPVINDVLAKNRAEPDPAKRKEYAEEVNQEFAKQCWILPTAWTIWGVPAKANIQGIGQATFPGGTGKLRDGAGFPGQVWFNNVWLKQ